MPQAQGQTPERKEAARRRIQNVQVYAVCPEGILKVQLEKKDMAGIFWAWPWREECLFRRHGDKSLHNYHYGTIKILSSFNG